MYVLENPIANTPAKDVEEEVRNEHQRRVDVDEQAAFVMLAHMSPELQKQHENMGAHTMVMHLKKLFNGACRTERYDNSKELFHCKMTNGFSVNTNLYK